MDMENNVRVIYSTNRRQGQEQHMPVAKGNLKGCTEALICSAQEQALRMNYVKFHIDKTGESPLSRMCKVENETLV